MTELSRRTFFTASVSDVVFRFGLAITSGGALSIAFVDQRFFLLTWITFVPLLWSMENASLRRSYALGFAAGIVFFISGSYWITDFIGLSKGYPPFKSIVIASCYWLYSAQLVALVSLLFSWLRQSTKLHEFLLFPLTVATLTSVFPMVFGLRLGDSQVYFPQALQALDIVGVVGLDVVIALTNVVVFRFVFRVCKSRGRNWRTVDPAMLLAMAVILSWFVYGAVQYPKWIDKTSQWRTMKVGLIQPNETPSLSAKKSAPGFSHSYPPALAMTERLSTLGVEFVVWPEARYQGYLDTPQIKRAFQSRVAEMQTTLIFQDFETLREPQTGQFSKMYNSAVMLNDQGETVAVYRKIKRIPFGEYVPLLSDHSSLKRWAEQLLGDFLNEVAQGASPIVFAHRDVNIIPLICYETTFPDFVAHAVQTAIKTGDKNTARMLVGMSNDGWFGTTVQPYQHVLPSVLRAVEHRAPLIHVVNNGPSIVASASGQLITMTPAFQAGGYTADVPYSSNAYSSVYSRHPLLVRNLVWLTMLFTVLFGIVRPRL